MALHEVQEDRSMPQRLYSLPSDTSEIEEGGEERHSRRGRMCCCVNYVYLSLVTGRFETILRALLALRYWRRLLTEPVSCFGKNTRLGPGKGVVTQPES